MDPSYGYYEVFETFTKYSDKPNANGIYEKKKEKRQLELVQCGTDNFIFKNKTEIIMYGVNKMMCLKYKNYTVSGDFYSEKFNYLTIKV